jgi:hypothetical protein
MKRQGTRLVMLRTLWSTLFFVFSCSSLQQNLVWFSPEKNA